MTTIQPISPNYTQYRNIPIQNVQFRGNLVQEAENVGEKFVNKLLNKEHVSADAIIEEITGPLGGFKKDKVKSVLTTFINTVKKLFDENLGLKIKLNNANNKINKFPQEKQNAVTEATERLNKSYQTLIQSKDNKIIQLREQVAELEKYEGMAKIKSVNDIGVLMPQQAIDLINEIVKKETGARKGMDRYLFNGDLNGLRDAKAQIERKMLLGEAQKNGITEISIVKDALANADNDGRTLIYGGDSYTTLDLIKNALEGSLKSEYLNIEPMKAQVKENAMALLRPMANETYCGTGIKNIERKLDEIINDAQNFHNGVIKGKANLLAQVGEGKKYLNIEFKPVEFNPKASKVCLTEQDKTTWTADYYWLSRQGNVLKI